MDSMSWRRWTLCAGCLLACAVFCFAAVASSDDSQKPPCDGQTPKCGKCGEKPACDGETATCGECGEKPACGCEKSPAPPVDDEVVEDQGFQFIAPQDHAVLMSGTFDVICRTDGDTLFVNGQAKEWDEFSSPVRVARLRLPPGVYEIRVGECKLDVVVAMNEEEHDGPEDWPYHYRHRIKSSPRRCAVCHETEQQDGQTSVGELKSYEACMKCHTEIDFEVTHSHILEPLQECWMCHSLHGSTDKSLLKAPMRTLCEKCHDPDH